MVKRVHEAKKGLGTTVTKHGKLYGNAARYVVVTTDVKMSVFINIHFNVCLYSKDRR